MGLKNKNEKDTLELPCVKAGTIFTKIKTSRGWYLMKHLIGQRNMPIPIGIWDTGCHNISQSGKSSSHIMPPKSVVKISQIRSKNKMMGWCIGNHLSMLKLARPYFPRNIHLYEGYFSFYVFAPF